MVVIAYTNISPITITYNNINHFIFIKKNINPRRLYVCVWDNYLFEDERFHFLNKRKNNSELLKENVEYLEKVMNYLKIDYRIIYLSEAWDRMLKSSEYSSDFQKILSDIKMGDIIDKAKTKYLHLNEVNVSKINYIVADYLIATNLNNIYPEICSSPPNRYIGLYIKLFEKSVNRLIKDKPFQKFPKISAVNNAPLILHKKSGLIPSKGMEIVMIKDIIKNNINSDFVNEREISDFIDVLDDVLGERGLEWKDKKVNKDELKYHLLNSLKDKELIIEVLSKNLINYYLKLDSLISDIPVSFRETTMYIKNPKEYDKYVKNLNNVKLRIIKLCDGKRSSLDISKKTGLNLSTVSTYLSRLKNMNIIDQDRKPKRKYDNLVINFDAFEGDKT